MSASLWRQLFQCTSCITPWEVQGVILIYNSKGHNSSVLLQWWEMKRKIFNLIGKWFVTIFFPKTGNVKSSRIRKICLLLLLSTICQDYNLLLKIQFNKRNIQELNATENVKYGQWDRNIGLRISCIISICKLMIYIMNIYIWLLNLNMPRAFLMPFRVPTLLVRYIRLILVEKR